MDSRLFYPSFLPSLRALYDAPLISRLVIAVYHRTERQARDFSVYVFSRVYIYMYLFPLFLGSFGDSIPRAASLRLEFRRLGENYCGVILDEIVPTRKRNEGGKQEGAIEAHMLNADFTARVLASSALHRNPILLRIAGSRAILTRVKSSCQYFDNTTLIVHP